MSRGETINESRGLPANLDAEKTILGSILLDNEAWPEVVQGLKPWDLLLDSHRRIARAMKNLVDASRTVDIVTLADALTKTGEIEAIGGVSYLASLTEGLPRRPVIAEYVQIVKDKSLLRQVMEACSTASARAESQEEPAYEVIGSLQSQIEELLQPGSDARKAAVENFIVGTADRAAREYATKRAPMIPTGNAWLDHKMGGGMRCGRYTIAAARPKIGKSGFGIRAVAYNCILGRQCTVFSLEMDQDEIACSLVPHVVDLPNIVATSPWLQTPEQHHILQSGLGKIAEWPLEVYDGQMDCDEICWTIDRRAKKHPDHLFVLDHFGLMGGGDKEIRKRYVENSERLRKKIKQHPSAALLNLFQLNEVPREFADKRPQPGDIGESKKPLQDCYAMILLHRYQDKDSLKMTKKANVNLALIRGGGAPGNVDCEFNTRRLCMDAEAELDYHDDED